MLLISLVAGFTGAFVMAIIQVAKMNVIGGQASNVPAYAFGRVFGIFVDALDPQQQHILTYIVHFAYGTAWGLALIPAFYFTDPFLSFVGVFFLIVWIQGLVVVPLTTSSGPPWEWSVASLFWDAFFHLVYATVAAGAFLYMV